MFISVLTLYYSHSLLCTRLFASRLFRTDYHKTPCRCNRCSLSCVCKNKRLQNQSWIHQVRIHPQCGTNSNKPRYTGGMPVKRHTCYTKVLQVTGHTRYISVPSVTGHTCYIKVLPVTRYPLYRSTASNRLRHYNVTDGIIVGSWGYDFCDFFLDDTAVSGIRAVLCVNKCVSVLFGII